MKRFILILLRKLAYLLKNSQYSLFRSKYKIHPSFRFNGDYIQFYGDGELEIDEDCYIGSLSTIQLHKDCKVVIGKGCSISHNVRMYTSSKLPDYDFSTKSMVPEKTGNIIIEDYVWIGANVFINPGVKIGKNCVVGANSVITKDLEENGIYGGVPARLIRHKLNV